MERSMLTTTDNPYDPFTSFREWYAWDTRMGYHSAALLARLTLSSEELSEADQHLAVERAIDEIVSENITGMFQKLKRNFPED